MSVVFNLHDSVNVITTLSAVLSTRPHLLRIQRYWQQIGRILL